VGVRPFKQRWPLALKTHLQWHNQTLGLHW
jgi:hypothetical protein